MLFFNKICQKKRYFLITLFVVFYSSVHAMDEKNVPEFLQQINHGFEYNNPGEIAGSLNTLIEKIPQWMRDRNQKEAFYHSIAHTLIRFTNNFVKSDTPGGSGFTDSFIQTKGEFKKSYILEFKIEENVSQRGQISGNINALKQIFDRDYYKEHQQDDIPMTLAAISFYKNNTQKKIVDNFKNLTCSALHLDIREKSLIGKFFQDTEDTGKWSIGDEFARHSKCEEALGSQVWGNLHIKKSSVGLSDDIKKGIESYHINLQKIRTSIEENDIPLFMKNIECILHALPCHLRCPSRSYYQAIVYTTLLCTGLDIEEEADCITVEYQGRKTKIYCFFSQKGDVSDEDFAIPSDLQKCVCDKMLLDAEKKNTTVIALSIIKPTEKSKIELKGKAIFMNERGNITMLKESGEFEGIVKKRLRSKLLGTDAPISPFTPQGEKRKEKGSLQNAKAKRSLDKQFEQGELQAAPPEESTDRKRKNKEGQFENRKKLKRSEKK